MKRVLVYGGNGALGRAVVNSLRKSGNFHTISADFPGVVAPAGEVFAPLDPSASVWDNVTSVSEVIEEKSSVGVDGRCLHAVVHVAGGWAPGMASSGDFLANTAKMIEMNAMSAAAAAHLASKHLLPSGVCVLTGANVALKPCPSMLSYAVRLL
jgi:NAD(P)-dependent dehydrogenase (short-subunit alcohol dehydrogenase family)